MTLELLQQMDDSELERDARIGADRRVGADRNVERTMIYMAIWWKEMWQELGFFFHERYGFSIHKWILNILPTMWIEAAKDRNRYLVFSASNPGEANRCGNMMKSDFRHSHGQPETWILSSANVGHIIHAREFHSQSHIILKSSLIVPYIIHSRFNGSTWPCNVETRRKSHQLINV